MQSELRELDNLNNSNLLRDKLPENIFKNMLLITTSILCNKERCKGFTKTNKPCRRRLKIDQQFFCCLQHEAINMNELRNEGCYICMEEIDNIEVLKCNHAIHKLCFMRLGEVNVDIKCPLCRNKTNKRI